jgi:hypothetical protein
LQLLSDDELSILKTAAREAQSVADASNKMFEPVYQLKTGEPVSATRGLEDRMCVQTNQVEYYQRLGKDVEGIQEEVDSFSAVSTDPESEEVRNVKEVKSLLKYILFETTSEKEYKNGIRDHGRPLMTLKDFKENPKAIKARLTEAELVALRLYTTIAFLYMNGPLRNDERYKRGEPCPLPVTTTFALRGIKKLRALHEGCGQMTLWRGMRDLDVDTAFMQKGGTELAFMSTTMDLNVAVRYCLSNHSLIFKVVSLNFMTMGADVQWLSAFPGEAEILYPPLTYLKPTGRKQVVKI